MTTQQAINQLNDLIQVRQSLCNGNTEHDAVYVDDISALNIAVAAIRRQIPMMVIPYNIFQRYCGQCGTIVKSYYKYCDECGQALDWSDEE